MSFKVDPEFYLKVEDLSEQPLDEENDRIEYVEEIHYITAEDICDEDTKCIGEEITREQLEKLGIRLEDDADENLYVPATETVIKEEPILEHVPVFEENLQFLFPQRPRRFFCDFCKSGFYYKYALRHHMNLHLMTDSNRIVCHFCQKEFDEVYSLKVHLQMYHNQIIKCPPGPVKGPSKQHRCEACFIVLKSENAARNHMLTVHNMKRIQMKGLRVKCEECDRTFSNRPNLVNHINSAHLKVKPCECDVCGERFCKNTALHYHRMIHTGEKPFQCGICKRNFRLRNDMLRHVAVHVRNNEIDFEHAFGVNTSTSKLVTKRQIFLKDCKMKKISEVQGQGKKRRAPKRRAKAPKGEGDINKAVTEMEWNGYEEVVQEAVISGGRVVVEEVVRAVRNLHRHEERIIDEDSYS